MSALRQTGMLVLLCLGLSVGLNVAHASPSVQRVQVPLASLGDQKALEALAESLDSADASIKQGALNTLTRALTKNPAYVLQIASRKGLVSQVCGSGLVEAPAQLELNLLLAARASVSALKGAGNGAKIDPVVLQECMDRLESSAKSLATGKFKRNPDWAKANSVLKMTNQSGRFEPNVARVFARNEPKYGAQGEVLQMPQRGGIKIQSTASVALGMGLEQIWVQLKQPKKAAWVPLYDLCAISVLTGSRERVMEQLRDYQSVLGQTLPPALPELNKTCHQWIDMELNAM